MSDKITSALPVTYPMQTEECPDCHHNHAGDALGNICIGCPCETRPPDCATCRPIALAARTEGKLGYTKCARCIKSALPPPHDHTADEPCGAGCPSMSLEQATRIARLTAVDWAGRPGAPAYLPNPGLVNMWEPHAWVVDAIIRGARAGAEYSFPWPTGQTLPAGKLAASAMADDNLARMAASRSLHRRPRRPGSPAPSDDDLAMADLHAAAELGCHCSGFVCTMHKSIDELAEKRPPVVVIVGEANADELGGKIMAETLAGRITLTPVEPFFGHLADRPANAARPADVGAQPQGRAVPARAGGGRSQRRHAELTALMKRQLDMSDELYVLNPGGRVTPWAAMAVEYAELCGIPIRWLESPS